MDRGGSPVLSTGFYGGSFVESRMGLPPSRLLNVGDPTDRQIVFYDGLAQLVGKGAYQNYWRPGGGMASLMSEFSVAYENARARAGVVIPESVKMTYDARIIAYASCMGLADGIQHCDGTMGILAEQIIPQEHELSLGWNESKRDMMLSDPAIGFPLTWIRALGDNGNLPYYWSLQKKDPTSIPRFVDGLSEQMAVSPEWQAYRTHYQIPEGIEKSLIKIAMAYYIVEDLPSLHRRLANGTTVFTYEPDPVNHPGVIGPDVNPTASNMGFLPFDDVYYSLVDPAGILRFKQICPDDPEIVQEVANWYQFVDQHFTGGLGNKRPSEISVKDLKRSGKVWDLLYGGSQGSSMADFTKFGEAVYALCNLYNMPNEALTNRANILGYMVGEAVYIKTLALMVGVPKGETMAQLQRVLSLGPLDTPAELEKVSAGVLGSQAVGFHGAQQVAAQFGLHIGTEHYNIAVAMLKTGVSDPKRARMVQNLMVGASALNRLTGMSQPAGKKR